MIDISNQYNSWYYYLGDKLIKEKKPVLPGEFIHTHSLMGCYRVYDVNISHFTIMKDRVLIKLPWNEFRCKKGQGTSIETKIKRTLKNNEKVNKDLDMIKFKVSNLAR